jgi:hypothetical protein
MPIDGKQGGLRVKDKRMLILFLVTAMMLGGCRAVNLIKKDMPIEDMDYLEEKYLGRTGWTKSYLVDMGQNGVLEQDTKVEIVELDMHWNGAVGVKAPDNHKYRHALELERPVTREKFEDAINRLLWFQSPEKRYRENLWEYGKELAKAILNHELLKGMNKDAALESWGPPDKIERNEIGGVDQEQWIYRDPRDDTSKSYIVFEDGLVAEWSE